MRNPTRKDELRSGKAAGVLLVILVLVLLGVGALALMNRRDQVASVNEEIRYDDFGYAVTGARYEKVIGTGAAAMAPRGTFCIVTLDVRNHAQRVGYRFDPKIAVLTDDQGHEFDNAPRARSLLNEQGGGDPCAGEVAAGQSCTTDLVFDVPEDSRGLMLRLSYANALTDLLDTVFWGRKRIRLPQP
jgi:hypothetical protein